MQPAPLEIRPPHIEFETIAVEKRKLIEEGGTAYLTDVDFIHITPAGSKDRIPRVWSEYDAYLTGLVANGFFPASWHEEYRAAYKSWKNGQGIPVVGTPIANWAVCVPSERKALLRADVRTVEEVAQMNEVQISQVGMGARALKQRAIDYLAAKQNIAPVVEQVEALRVQNEALQAQIAALSAKAPVAGVSISPSAFVHSRPVSTMPDTLDDDINSAVDAVSAEMAVQDAED